MERQILLEEDKNKFLAMDHYRTLKIYSNILNENTEDDLSKLINKIKNFQADNGYTISFEIQ